MLGQVCAYLHADGVRHVSQWIVVYCPITGAQFDRVVEVDVAGGWFRRVVLHDGAIVANGDEVLTETVHRPVATRVTDDAPKSAGDVIVSLMLAAKIAA